MKIHKISIGGFGKLEHRTLELNDGMNLLYGDNEAGKTTWMQFLRVMFYGTGKQNRDFVLNLREKYTPLSGAPMGGSIEFSYRNENWRLERTFSTSDAKDSVLLYNLTSGKQKKCSGSNPFGEQFFGLNQEAFLRSCYLSSTGFLSPDEEAASYLAAKLSNLAAGSEETVSAELVQNRLIKAREKFLSKSKKIGALDKANARLNEKYRELQEAGEREAHRLALKRKLTEAQSRQQAAEQQIRECNDILKQLDRQQLSLRYADLLSQQENLTRLQQKLADSQGGPITAQRLERAKMQHGWLLENEESLRRQQETVARLKAEWQEKEASCSAAGELDRRREQLQVLANRQAQLKQQLPDLDQKQTSLDQTVSALQKKKRLFLILGLLLTAALAVPAVQGGFFLFLFASAALLCALLFVLLFCRTANRLKKTGTARQSLEDERRRIQLRLSEEAAQISAGEEACRAMEKNHEAQLSLITSLKEHLQAETGRLSQLEASRSAALSEFRLLFPQKTDEEILRNFDLLMLHLKDTVSRADAIQAKIRLLGEQLPDTREETVREQAALVRQLPDAARVSERLQNARQIRDEAYREATQLLAVLKTDFAAQKNPATIAAEIREEKGRIAEYTRTCQALNTAIEAVREAAGEVQKDFTPALCRRASQLFAALTGNRYESLQIAGNLSFLAQTADGYSARRWEQLSAGTLDQAYLAVRLAVCEILSRNEPLPLILDDPLCQYDDTRAETALRFLKEYAKDRQVLFFTCHRSLCDASAIDLSSP